VGGWVARRPVRLYTRRFAGRAGSDGGQDGWSGFGGLWDFRGYVLRLLLFFLSLLFFLGLLLFLELADENGGEGFLPGGALEFGGWCECPEGGIGGDFFDRLCRAGGLFRRLAALEVERGDLESVEEESGALGVDFVGGDALEDDSDGLLDRGAVFWEGDVEGALDAVAGAAVR
jgi:hypothetical protein